MRTNDRYEPPKAALREPPRLGEAKFRLGPVLVCAILIDLFGTVILTVALAVPFTIRLVSTGVPQAELEAALALDPAYNLISMALCFGLTAVAGFVAARWAGNQHVKHGIAVGAISTLVSLPILLLSQLSDAFFPAWFNYVSVLVMMPLGAAGGMLARRAG